MAWNAARGKRLSPCSPAHCLISRLGLHEKLMKAARLRTCGGRVEVTRQYAAVTRRSRGGRVAAAWRPRGGHGKWTTAARAAHGGRVDDRAPLRADLHKVVPRPLAQRLAPIRLLETHHLAHVLDDEVALGDLLGRAHAPAPIRSWRPLRGQHGGRTTATRRPRAAAALRSLDGRTAATRRPRGDDRPHGGHAAATRAHLFPV